MGFSLKLDERVPQRFVDPPYHVEPQREPVKFEAGQVVQTRPMRSGGASVDVWIIAGGPADGYIGYPSYAMNEPALRRTLTDENAPMLLSPAPRRGDTWSNGESVAHIELCAHGDTSLRIVSDGEPFVGDVVAVARRLWDGGYRRVEATEARGPARVKAVHVNGKTMPLPAFTQERLSGDALTLFARAHFGLERLPSESDDTLRERMQGGLLPGIAPIATALVAQRASFAAVQQMNEARERQVAFDDACRRVAWDFGVSSADADVAIRRLCASLPWSSEQVFAAISAHDDVIWHELRKHFNRVGSKQPPQHVDCRIRCTDLLDSTRADRATGDDLSDIAEVHGVPVLRAGMVVHHDGRGACGAFGCITEVSAHEVRVRWPGSDDTYPYIKSTAETKLRRGTWRIVTPDLRPLASLANAVAAVFARPDLATSRRYIDQAIASLRGEPFAAAVAAALVASGDHPLSPHQIAALVRGARAHEARRSEVAPARRTLTAEQLSECFTAGMRASEGEWYARLSHVYERARTA